MTDSTNQANKLKQIDTGRTLFNWPDWKLPKLLDVEKSAIAIQNGIYEGSLLSRDELAEKISRETGEKCTKAKLDSYTCQSKPDNRLSFTFAVALSQISGSLELLRLFARKLGMHVISDEEKKLLDYAKTCREIEALKEKAKLAKLNIAGGRR